MFILSFLALGFAKAQNIQFEDANFEATLLSASPDNKIAKDAKGNSVAIDANGDGKISQAEALNVYQLDIEGERYKYDVESMKGIEYFTNLTVLSCLNFYKLKNLDVSNMPNLVILECSITTTGGYNSALEYLDVSKNINLQRLGLQGFAGIKTMDVSKNINLQRLDLNSTRIETLDVSKNIELLFVNLDRTGIKTLDVSKNIKLWCLYLSSTEMQTLDISKNISLIEMYLGNTEIKILDISKNINLQGLYLSNTKIETLDVSKNTNLKELYLSNTEMKTLDVSNNINLGTLNLKSCSGFTSLYMKNGVKKTFGGNGKSYIFRGTNLNYICCDEDEIDEVKKYMQDLGRTSNLTITSDCETKPQEKTVLSKKTSEKL